ncbi:T9SS type A sorting domain-containing protein [Dyadobacter chenwenxiniae]|uniref:T9SS type A sorting domain-containing protein n=1 Tax=Dyadobacter chenwenxiniae TaxID=2906456 RepID=A0A9X1PJP4_9BACT|nr:T9SS type A sorting domain-containing protein [Dyadobacter chenwenxiniae]MCF0061996.1 T9SS type A sorting domain-containing protein [Dyadobacter chenwenxiniae]UON81807.1 T9SS type A sorting domain-containing protein [Dyadobacter chenwenxiniae]
MKHLFTLFSLLVFPCYAFAQWSDNPSINTRICDSEAFQDDQELATDNAGGTFIAWKDLRSGALHLYAQHIDSEGFKKWPGEGVPIATATESDEYLLDFKLVADGDGGVIIAWADARNEAPYEFNADIYAQRINANGEVQWTFNGETVCDASGLQFSIDVMEDGSGGIFIVWEDNRDVNPNIYAQHINHSGKAEWTANGMPVSKDNVNPNIRPQLVADGNEGVMVFWHQTTSPYDRYFKAQRLSKTGAQQWSDGGLQVITLGYADPFIKPEIIADGEGGAIVSWYEHLGDSHQILAQRINSTGLAMWPGRAIDICKNILGRAIPEMVTDNNGGAIVIWGHGPTLQPNAIHGQRVNAAGQLLWPTTGLPVINRNTKVYDYQLVTDGADGAIIAWTDATTDIRAQRITGAGVLQWHIKGAAICNADNNQGRIRMVSNGNHEALIFWVDLRTEPPKIYGNITNNEILLPVTLVAFDAVAEQSQIQLLWTTATEINNDHFKIERSKDGRKFEKIGEVAASSDLTAQKHYQYTDRAPLSGINYYRLKQLDHDGKFAYSKMVRLDFKNGSKFLVFPNPASKAIYVETPYENGNIQVTDMIGRAVFNTPPTGTRTYVDIANLPVGMYVVKTISWNQIFMKH